jgi:hypothetical protein
MKNGEMTREYGMHAGHKKCIHKSLLGIPSRKVPLEDLGIYCRILFTAS